MSDISRLVLNTMLYEMNNSNSSQTTSNPESFSKLLQTSLMSSGSSGCSCNSSSGISSLGMIVTLTGLLNQNKIYESTSSTNNELDSNSQTTEINNQNSNVNSSTSVSNSTTATNSNMDKAIDLLKQQLGKPYVWGDEGPDSFDCSGLVQYIYKNALGKDLPRVSYDQSKVGQAVSREDLQPGDLVFFDTMDKGKVSHVGRYIGNNEFIHAANSKKGVIKSTLTGYYEKKFINARRP
ncbi:MAG: C40 family peptidase [Romboutsia timonensis]|uniref:C40 family peptidase n=1 Tax=Romboutsia timonensis TaxID=1776391 RepID=UPI002A75250C|nr:C40 family peptidase [Romboutsia timonensis]MDY3002143.1 C40 family peptidase [Romboutsia timonensis]